MKQIILSLLTYSICLSAFTQIDTSKKINPGYSDKWEIIKGNIKSSTGKLFVTLPKGTEWDMTIYAAGTTKVLSNTSLKTSFTLQPGTYDLQINKIRIKGVPVEKGNNTRLKAGVLHITTPDSWTLYDETKQTVLINSLSPQERGLPIGKYKLTILGQVQDIEIKDENPGQEKLPIIETDKWVMSPTYQNEGRLTMKFPLANPDAFFPLNNAFAIVKAGESYYGATLYSCHHIFTTGLSCPTSYELPEGNYDIYFMEGGESFNHQYKISNVPIRYKYETRLKVGYFKFLAKGLYHIYDPSMQHLYFENNVQGAGQYPLPVGLYHIKLFFVGEYQLQINDGGVSVLNPIDSVPIPEPGWIIRQTIDQFTKEPPVNFGRLNCSFPEANNMNVSIEIPKTTSREVTVTNLLSLKSIDLLRGNYKVTLNSFPVELAVQSGKETMIRFGYLDIHVGGQQGIEWRIYKGASLGGQSIGSYNNRVLGLPIGYYTIYYNLHSYLIKINEGERLIFDNSNI